MCNDIKGSYIHPSKSCVKYDGNHLAALEKILFLNKKNRFLNLINIKSNRTRNLKLTIDPNLWQNIEDFQVF